VGKLFLNLIVSLFAIIVPTSISMLKMSSGARLGKSAGRRYNKPVLAYLPT